MDFGLQYDRASARRPMYALRDPSGNSLHHCPCLRCQNAKRSWFFVGRKSPTTPPATFQWRLCAALPLSQCEHHARKKKGESLGAPRLLVSRDCTYGHHPGACPPSMCGSSSSNVCSMHIRSLVISFWHVHRLIVWLHTQHRFGETEAVIYKEKHKAPETREPTCAKLA